MISQRKGTLHHPATYLVMLLTTALLSLSLQSSEAFTWTKLPTFSSRVHSINRNHAFLCQASNDKGDFDDDDDGNRNESVDEQGGELGIPCLPPIGESSFSNNDPSKDGDNNVITLNGDAKEIGHVGSKRFELQYTCNKCNTRNSHSVSRLAYRKGVVIAVCKGCMAKHLIADNLGWSGFIPQGFTNDATNIEESMDLVGKGEEVNRVSKDVFDLENILYNGPELYKGSEDSNIDSISGSAKRSDTDGIFE